MGCRPTCCSSNNQKNCISVIYNIDSEKLPSSVLKGFAEVLGSFNNQDDIVQNFTHPAKLGLPSHSTQDQEPKIDSLMQSNTKTELKKSLSEKTVEIMNDENKGRTKKIRAKSEKVLRSRDEENRWAILI
jgi:hypothetical protein